MTDLLTVTPTINGNPTIITLSTSYILTPITTIVDGAPTTIPPSVTYTLVTVTPISSSTPTPPLPTSPSIPLSSPSSTASTSAGPPPTTHPKATSMPTLLPPSVSTTTSSGTSPSSTSSRRNVNIGVGGLVGALFGGLIVGALIVAAILLFLRSRRRTKDLPASNGAKAYASASPWEGERKTLLAQLNEAQAERAQLRTYLELADTQDPRDVVESFDKLNVSVRNSCLLASGVVLKSFQSNPSWTTADAVDLKQLQQDLDGAPRLVLSERGAGRKLEEFFPEAFRYIVNFTLMKSLFELFHPGVSEDENKLLSEMYRDVRSRDSQRLAARWRCLTYSAIDNRMPPSSDWPARFADDVLTKLSSMVSSLFGETPNGIFPAKFRSELTAIGTDAYKWNRAAKSTFKSLDFRPVLFTSGDPYDPASMTLYLSHKPEKLPRNIIVGVSLALMSTSAVSVGEEIREEYVWQTKAEVLTEGFFA